jgi:hypothetical protein
MSKNRIEEDTDETWDLPRPRNAHELKVGHLIWVARKYRTIREIKDQEDDRLILLEGLAHFLVVPEKDVFWSMNEARPDTGKTASDEQQPLHVEAEGAQA